MNYFDCLTFEKGVITVLGVDADSDFVKSLSGYLKSAGSVVVTTEDIASDNDYIIYVPDKFSGGCFVMHTDLQVEQFCKSRCIIGVVSVNVLEKKIGDVVVGAEKFAEYNDLTTEELIFPLALAKVIQGHEKYDFLYIDDVDNESKRYLARELAKRHKNGTCVRMINTDHPYVERLVEPQSNI